MRTVRLALCLIGLSMLYPAVSKANDVCYSALVPAANPQWKTACDGGLGGTTGHSWGVTKYSVTLDPYTVGGSISYGVYTPRGWFYGNDGLQIPQPNYTDAIRLFRVTSFTGAGTLLYRGHVGNVGWVPIVGPGSVVGQTNQTLQAIELNVHFPGESEFWQDS